MLLTLKKLLVARYHNLFILLICIVEQVLLIPTFYHLYKITQILIWLEFKVLSTIFTPKVICRVFF